MNLKTQGYVLLDVDVVALNNAGKTTDANFDNAVGTKTVYKGGKAYVYVSGQAWRYWWREALQKNHAWAMSPITRDNKIAFTEADPLKYDDDDVFGYMKATKVDKLDAEGNVVLKKNGEPDKENGTVTRVSPLKNSAIVSVAATQPSKNWSSMARQVGDSVPYVKDEYSAIMKGMFSLDLSQVGTFSDYNKTGFKNITSNQRETILAVAGSEAFTDAHVKTSKGEAQQLVRLAKTTRIKRSKETIQALKTISGGAMQTNNMADVTPKFIVLASMTTGNHPFSHIATTDRTEKTVILSIEALKEVLKDYKNQFVGTVYIGRRKGFMDEIETELKELEKLGSEAYPSVKVASINEAIDQYCQQLETQMT
ncbi:MAG: type I-B CRISPR-associated protein Cas7/Cst2/DevR [Saprospiraceae bacterium]|nr:type I-B CRISPR-associated protein Cas7/Cst2/DevR [Saprospiraceae bacterium]